VSKPVPWVKYEEVEKNMGRFVVSPLGRGMGVTLGNSMRRVLLSSLAGHAITSVKIDGCQHEFSTIPNVVEDVFDVICNIKAIVFKCHTDEPKKLKIEQKGKGVVTAKDIICDSEVEILTPNQHIAEVADKGKLVIEMTLEKGIGYEASEKHQKEDQAIDTITIDSSFSPIKRVNHVVENIRVGEELDFDSLTLEVWTNGSTSAESAIKQASAILVEKFQLFQTLNQKPEGHDAHKGSKNKSEEKESTPLNLTVDDLELSARSSNCLKRAGIETVAELIEKDLSELNQIKNFGKKSADEINAKLKQFNLALKG
jgi:DNA-directed RNA polymerase subunit alpha